MSVVTVSLKKTAENQISRGRDVDLAVGCRDEPGRDAGRAVVAGLFGHLFGDQPARGLYFFFQAEDGIRDLIVTGVQTCALPIWPQHPGRRDRPYDVEEHATGGE